MTFKVIVAGSRNFDDYELLKNKLNHLLKNKDSVEIVSGTAKGADKLGERYANETNSKLTLFPADWDRYGKSAGYIRNKQMAIYADAAIIFWDGESKGAKHMIDLANSQKIEVRVVNYNRTS